MLRNRSASVTETIGYLFDHLTPYVNGLDNNDIYFIKKVADKTRARVAKMRDSLAKINGGRCFMAFNIDTTTNTLSRDEFDRLYSEAFDYISIERQRLGEDAKELVWNTFEQPNSFIHRYVLDDYLVGAASLTEFLTTYEGASERWAW